MGGGPEFIPVRLARGETADILILNRPPLDELTDAGHIRPESRVDLVRSVIGMAVRSGAPKPDISTREALIETLLAAIGYSASVSGTYLGTLWRTYSGHAEQATGPRRQRRRQDRCRQHPHELPEAFYNPHAVAQDLGDGNDAGNQREAGRIVNAAIRRHLEQREDFGCQSTYSGRSRPRIVRTATLAETAASLGAIDVLDNSHGTTRHIVSITKGTAPPSQ